MALILALVTIVAIAFILLIGPEIIMDIIRAFAQ